MKQLQKHLFFLVAILVLGGQLTSCKKEKTSAVETEQPAVQFTASEAGKYLCIVTLQIKLLDDGEWLESDIYKNGVRVNLSSSYSPGDNKYINSTCLAIIDLAANDYIEHYARHNHGSNLDTNGIQAQVWMQVAKIA